MTFKLEYGLRMVIISHRESGLDIAPAIREHSTYFVRQLRDQNDRGDDVYSAEFYDRIEDGEPTEECFTLKPDPEVQASYNPDETATFDISD